MLKRLIEKIKFNKKFGKKPTVGQLLQEWIQAPEKHFMGYYEQNLEWTTFYDPVMTLGFPDSHGLSSFPKICCKFKSLLIGNIEGISMYSGGIVRIEHFALNSQLTNSGIGVVFFNAIKKFFKNQNAVVIEFHENHRSKIEHYRKFFQKLEVQEVDERVWRLDLYWNESIPQNVLEFHESLKKESK